jgi:hypothetical protein
MWRARPQELVRLRAELLPRLEPLLRERAALADGAGAAGAAGVAAGGGADAGADTVAALSVDYLRCAHQAERLAANLEADHGLMRDFCARVTCRVLTPRQYAQALVASFPYLPDALALAGCVAAGEPAGGGGAGGGGGLSAGSRLSADGERAAGQAAAPGLASPPSSGSRRDALPVAAWPGPPPAPAGGGEGDDPNPDGGSDDAPDKRAAAGAPCLKKARPSGEAPAVSGSSMTSAYPAAACGPAQKP